MWIVGKYICMWNNYYRTPTECWQKTSDFPKDKYFFILFLFLWVCMCMLLCDFCLYSFAFTICPSVLSVLFFFFLSIVFSACYHWWICLLVWLLSLFLWLFNSLFLIIFKKFNNFILFYYYFPFFFFFSLFFWAVWLTVSCCSGRVSGLCLWGGRAEFRTLVHQRPPSSM